MTLRAIVLAAALLMIAANASAQVDPFEFEVYPYQTLGKGLAELESLNSFVPGGHNHGDAGTSSGDFASHAMYRTAFEFAYGLTDHVEGAASHRDRFLAHHGIYGSNPPPSILLRTNFQVVEVCPTNRELGDSCSTLRRFARSISR